jgi:hypothetical protein
MIFVIVEAIHHAIVILMPGKCANGFCSSLRTGDEGKLFRLDMDIGNTAGENHRKTAYVWLCDSCARRMRPWIEQAGNSVLVRLGAIPHRALHVHRPFLPRAN